MASSSSSSNKRASGGGRTSNSEPKVQVFQQFQGCNFDLSPKDMNFDNSEDPSQTDLQMTYVVLQNNCEISSNKSIETRQNIEDLFEPPTDGVCFTDVVKLIGKYLYVAMDDCSIWRYEVSDDEDIRATPLALTQYNNETGETGEDGEAAIDTAWSCFGYADDKLICLNSAGEIWAGDIVNNACTSIENAIEIPDPDPLEFSNLTAVGDLAISESMDEGSGCINRIEIQYTYVNQYGPTLPSEILTFWASAPTTEWSSVGYVRITGYAPAYDDEGNPYNIIAVELYYAEGDSQESAFLQRISISDLDADSSGIITWTYNWTGYLVDTTSLLVANITVPTQNYTKGVPASRMAQHDGRLYFWGGDPTYRIWIGGNPGNVLSVSTGVGGGYCDCEPGTGTVVRQVPKYKTASGASCVNVLTDNENSTREERHLLVETTATVADDANANGWQTEKVNGAVGCKSYDGAGVWADGLYAISRYGLALTTLTMEYNSQIRTTYVSDPIRPVFLDQYGTQLSEAQLLCVNDIIYMAFGKPPDEDEDDEHDFSKLDNVVFCYDIDLKSWWTFTLEVDEEIIKLFNVDYESYQEGIGIVTPNRISYLPTTKLAPVTELPTYDLLIETGELATKIPNQQMQHLTQIEFVFDHFIGNLEIELKCIDILGRHLQTFKSISHDKVQFGLHEYMRVDWKVSSYKLIFRGCANFRMTHFMSKLYQLGNKNGIVWGFDSTQTHNTDSDVRPAFKCYNDVRNAIIP